MAVTYANNILLVMSTLMIIGEMQFGSAQDCGCPTIMCCSQYGYCGITTDYCGIGCQQGPCHGTIGILESIEPIITLNFFNQIKSGNSATCVGNSFYSYDGFMSAIEATNFTGFGNTGNLEVRKRELAAFFANVAHETIHLCYVEEIEKGSYCEASTEYPCASGQEYYGRGPLQLSWNYNYGVAGDYFGLPLLNNPDLVAKKLDVAVKTSVWFWMNGSDCHDVMTSTGNGKGFADTIRAINGEECDGGEPSAMQDRVNLYTEFCKRLRVTPGPNLSC